MSNQSLFEEPRMLFRKFAAYSVRSIKIQREIADVVEQPTNPLSDEMGPFRTDTTSTLILYKNAVESYEQMSLEDQTAERHLYIELFENVFDYTMQEFPGAELDN